MRTFKKVYKMLFTSITDPIDGPNCIPIVSGELMVTPYSSCLADKRYIWFFYEHTKDCVEIIDLLFRRMEKNKKIEKMTRNHEKHLISINGYHKRILFTTTNPVVSETVHGVVSGTDSRGQSVVVVAGKRTACVYSADGTNIKALIELRCGQKFVEYDYMKCAGGFLFLKQVNACFSFTVSIWSIDSGKYFASLETGTDTFYNLQVSLIPDGSNRCLIGADIGPYGFGGVCVWVFDPVSRTSQLLGRFGGINTEWTLDISNWSIVSRDASIGRALFVSKYAPEPITTLHPCYSSKLWLNGRFAFISTMKSLVLFDGKHRRDVRIIRRMQNVKILGCSKYGIVVIDTFATLPSKILLIR